MTTIVTTLVVELVLGFLVVLYFVRAAIRYQRSQMSYPPKTLLDSENWNLKKHKSYVRESFGKN